MHASGRSVSISAEAISDNPESPEIGSWFVVTSAKQAFIPGCHLHYFERQLQVWVQHSLQQDPNAFAIKPVNDIELFSNSVSLCGFQHRSGGSRVRGF